MTDPAGGLAASGAGAPVVPSYVVRSDVRVLVGARRAAPPRGCRAEPRYPGSFRNPSSFDEEREEILLREDGHAEA